MRAEFQRLIAPAFCIRLWSDPTHGYGDPYDWAATALQWDEGSLEILGVTEPPTREMMGAIKAAAADLGYIRVGTKRIKPDRIFMRWHRVETPRYQNLVHP